MAQIVKVPGIEMPFAGQKYVIPPLSLGALEQLQDRLSAWDGTIKPETVSTVIDATHAALRRNYPEITRVEVADMVDMANMAEVMQAVMDVSGLRRKEIEAQGEAQAPVVTSTGASSMPGSAAVPDGPASTSASM